MGKPGQILLLFVSVLTELAVSQDMASIHTNEAKGEKNDNCTVLSFDTIFIDNVDL